MTAAEEQLVAELAEALRPAEPWPGAPSPEVIAARIAPAVQEWAAVDRRRAVAEALDETADKWQWGAWIGLPGLVEQRLAAAQYVTDWLRTRIRARADAVEGGGER